MDLGGRATISWRGHAAVLGVGVALAGASALPTVALAEPLMCDLELDGRMFCLPSSGACGSRRECVGPSGTEDWFCHVIGSGTGTPTCGPSCGTLFTCDPSLPLAGQCPPLVGRTAACDAVAADADIGIDVVPAGLCTYRATSRTAAIDYCPDGTADISGSRFRACHTMPPDAAGDPPRHTADYFRGDCDGDGCPNGHDTMPCATGGTCLATGEESPTCAPPPPLACAPGSAGLLCGDARPCTTAGALCAPGLCEAGWSQGGPRCRPECSTLFLCATTRDPTLVPGEEPACPFLGDEPGRCVPDPGMMPRVPDHRYDGVCVYSSWLTDGSCDIASADARCAVTVDGAATASFYAGDCDGDRIPNGCDTRVCDDTEGRRDACLEPPGDPTCRVMLPPRPDAGVTLDGGPSTDAAPSEDAASPRQDAGGAQGMDASSPGIDTGPPVSFGGGGGCRCRLARGASDRASFVGAAMVLALVASRRLAHRRRGRTRSVHGR